MTKTMGYGEMHLIREIIKNTWGEEALKTKKFTSHDVLYIIQEMKDEEGKAYLEHSSSIMRGFGVFRAFAKYLLYRNIANFDSMVLLTSEKGMGKSSSAIMLSRAWCKLLGIRFNPDRHIAYSNQDVMDKIKNLDRFEPIVCLAGNSKIKIKYNNKKYDKKISELVSMKNYEVLTYNINKNIYEYKKPEKTILQPIKKKTINIELENGKIIKVTEDHLILTECGYKKAKNLTENDKIKIIDYYCERCGKIIMSKVKKKFCSNKCSYKTRFEKNREKNILYYREYRKKNKEQLKLKRTLNKEHKNMVRKKYYKNNKRVREISKQNNKEYYKKNKVRMKESNKLWIKNNYERYKKYLNLRHKNNMKNNPEYKIKRNLRRRIGLALKDQGMIKDKSLKNYIGCSI
jgi:hypothetical protein